MSGQDEDATPSPGRKSLSACELQMLAGSAGLDRQVTEPQVTRLEDLPAHFRQGDVHGWTKAGATLPDDAIPTGVNDGGWDHQHCELCESHIGRGGGAHGYVDRNDRWLCERCFQNDADPRSLGFVFSI